MTMTQNSPDDTADVQFDRSLLDILGVGAQVLTQYLATVAESAIASSTDELSPPLPPNAVLCNICEEKIQPWFFEKHSELCVISHEAESQIQETQDELIEQQQSLLKFFRFLQCYTPMSAQSLKDYDDHEEIDVGDQVSESLPVAQHNYAELTKDWSASEKGSAASLVNTLVELCTTAIDISTPAIRDEDNRLQSPSSEIKLYDCLKWDRPCVTNQTLNTLCTQTYGKVRSKVEAAQKLLAILTYSEELRKEINSKIDHIIKNTISNAIAACGMLPDDQTYGEHETHDDNDLSRFTFETDQGELLDPADYENCFQKSQPISIKRIEKLPTPVCSSFRLSEEDSANFLPSKDKEFGLPSSPYSLDSARSANASRNSKGIYDSPRRVPSPLRRQSSPLAFGKLNISNPGVIHKLSTSFLTSMGGPDQQTGHYRQDSSHSDLTSRLPPLSPRMPSISCSNRPVTSMKDFKIIKPISKGAFGTVYLTTKKSTGDYYAIKVLKKADMISKNQITNVKAERAIMMAQGESPFVAKLYYTFQSREYLYLVMEYLNGGDCACLLKNMGSLPEDWARQYIAQVILGVEDLHRRGIMHRDLKPDNILIDSSGHLKLTDFGLSRMGLVGRHTKSADGFQKHDTTDSRRQGFYCIPSTSRNTSSCVFYDSNASPTNSPSLIADTLWGSTTSLSTLSKNLTEGIEANEGPKMIVNPLHFETQRLKDTWLSNSLSKLNMDSISGIGQNDGCISSSSTSTGSFQGCEISRLDSRALSVGFNNVGIKNAEMPPPSMSLYDPNNKDIKHFVGTPDYLSPETINGVGQDDMGDWWSVGCILFEFLLSYPPFHAEEPKMVFAKILAREIDWPPRVEELITREAIDLINSLLCIDPSKRLGIDGAYQIKNHSFFREINWETLMSDDSPFIPRPENLEDTNYFDQRGSSDFPAFETAEDAKASAVSSDPNCQPNTDTNRRMLLSLAIPPHIREQRRRDRRLSEPFRTSRNDFGSFTFRNLGVLERANKAAILRMKTEQSSRSPSTMPSSPLSGDSELLQIKKQQPSPKHLSCLSPLTISPEMSSLQSARVHKEFKSLDPDFMEPNLNDMLASRRSEKTFVHARRKTEGEIYNCKNNRKD